ncbi:hypothetical protein [Streptosporangium sp. NPDC049644]|uniref:hypothetical protein n=1 Tax=Streptosporangium sp. NPDC049644 TaxID=3155507 RepID=UPI003425ED37
MEQFIASLEQARKVIGEETERILNALSAAGADRSAALRIREIEGWLEQEIPRLRRRNQMIQEPGSLTGWAPGLTGLGLTGPGPLGLAPPPGGGGLMAFDEKGLAARTLADDEGGRLAETLARLSGAGPHSSGNDYDRAFEQLAARRGDADLTAGFFAVLGPRGAAAVLRELNHYRGESAREHWKTMGEALAGAVARRPKTLGPAWEPESLGRASAADLGLLLGHGRFPAGWLTEVVRPRVRKSPGDGVLARWTADLSHFLSALANNPEAARALFNDLPREDLRDLSSELNGEVSLYPNEHDAIAFDLEAEFGRMLAAANEVQGKMDEYDQEMKDRLFFLLGLGVDAAGFAASGLKLVETSFDDFIWFMISKSTSETIDSYKDIDETRLDRLKESNRLATLGREYWIFHELKRYGFSYPVPPDDPAFSQPPITGKNGNLLPFKEFAKDPKALKNFTDWLIRNGSGNGDVSTAGEAATRLKVAFGGAKDNNQTNPLRNNSQVCL